jgi:hypothetical protein
LSHNLIFKLFTMFCIAFSATKDIETSLISICLFIAIIHIIRSPKEREDVSWNNLI